MIDLYTVAAKADRELRSAVERELVRIIEVLEGRVLNSDEAKKHGRREICSDGSETYFWRDKIILQVVPDGTLRWKVKVLKLED